MDFAEYVDTIHGRLRDIEQRFARTEKLLDELTEPVALDYVLLRPDSKSPTKAHKEDSGWDLYAYPLDGNDNSIEEVVIKAKQTTNIFTGVAVRPPAKWGYSLRGRSSLNKKGIQTLLGTVDSSYSGKLLVLMYNGTDSDYIVKKNDRIGQIVIERTWESVLNRVDQFYEIKGARNAGGFGSSGT